MLITNNMEVLGIGEIVLDKTYIISGDINSGQKSESSDSQMSIGGPVPSALKLLKNLGCKVRIIGSIGKGPLGKFAQKEFKKYEIEEKLILDKLTKVNSVIVNKLNGTRTIIKDKVQNKKIKKIPLKYIKDADVIIFDRSEKEAFKFVLENKKVNTKIILDPSTEWNEEIIFMSKNSHVPIFPIETLEKINEKNDFETNIKKLYNVIGKTIIITAGDNGAFLYDGRDLKHYDAAKVCSIDSNGAGDVFRGAIAYGILQDWNLEKSIIFANKVAGLQCTKKGNLSAVPNLDEINNFIL